MEIPFRELHRYVENFLEEEDPILLEMEQHAREINFPFIGRQVGRLLFLLSRIMRPEWIFECGSGFGYSAYWFLKGHPGANLVFTDFDEQNLNLARHWLKRAGLAERVDFRCGNALDILKETYRKFDIILNDANKEQYPEIFPLAIDHLRENGLLITDNLFFHGDVLKTEAGDKRILGIRKYTHLMFETEDLLSTILPIRDGVGLSLKLS